MNIDDKKVKKLWGHCFTCFYWGEKKNTYLNEKRECLKLTRELHNENGLLDCTTGDESEPFITTAENFVCLNWLPRK
ncbi:MAG: hypothetical protein WC356_01905 [Candidatus Micrarchaeia archaeon]|jgi:hypothetical protein